MAETTPNKSNKQARSHTSRNYTWLKNALLVLLADVIGTWGAFLFALLLRFDFSYSQIPENYFMWYLYLILILYALLSE